MKPARRTIEPTNTNAIVIAPKTVRPQCPNHVNAATPATSASASGTRKAARPGEYAMIAEAPAATLIPIVSP